MSVRSNCAVELLPLRFPPNPIGSIVPPALAVFDVLGLIGSAFPNPVTIVCAALPAPALPDTLLLDRTTLPPGNDPNDPCRSPNPPVASVYWIPAALSTSGNPSPFMSTKSSSPVLSPMAMLPPAEPTGAVALPVSDSCDELASRGTARPSDRSEALGNTIDSAPSRELLAPLAVTKLCTPVPGASCGLLCPNPHSPSRGEGTNGITFGGATCRSEPKSECCGSNESSGIPSL